MIFLSTLLWVPDLTGAGAAAKAGLFRELNLPATAAGSSIGLIFCALNYALADLPMSM
jgi:hypothetical protein